MVDDLDGCDLPCSHVVAVIFSVGARSQQFSFDGNAFYLSFSKPHRLSLVETAVAQIRHNCPKPLSGADTIVF
jgi:hypothetical protein